MLASNFEIKNVWSQVVLDHAPLTERESVVLVRSCAKQKLKAIPQSSPTDTQARLRSVAVRRQGFLSGRGPSIDATLLQAILLSKNLAVTGLRNDKLKISH